MESQRKTTPPKRTVRLNRFIAQCGITSRRKADHMIRMGQIKLNGEKVFELGVQVDPLKDKVSINGEVVRPIEEKIYVMFNKPKDVVTTLSDPEGRACVGDYFRDFGMRLFPVGRLDWDSEGLLLLTNDGEFANQIMHPKTEIPKTYLVKIDGHLAEADIKKLTSGVSILGGRVHAKQVEPVKRGRDRYGWYKIVISEGKNRQIHRMFEKIEFDVMKIQRVAVGSLYIGSLERGEHVILGKASLDKIFVNPLVEKKVHNRTPRVASSKKKPRVGRTTS